MPFTHHSHSGQFCHHGRNKLEEMVLAAIEKRFSMVCLTEHIPRQKDHLYPEEVGVTDEEGLRQLFTSFLVEAVRLRRKYSNHIDILVGFETEWLPSRSPSSPQIVENLAKDGFTSLLLSSSVITSESELRQAVTALSKPDLFIGSVHHVNNIPIDFDRQLYEKARSSVPAADPSSPPTDEDLFVAYFEHVLDMLIALSPPIIGHFDLPRLFCEGGYPPFAPLNDSILEENANSKEIQPRFHPLRPLSTSSRLRTLVTTVLERALSNPTPAVLEINTSALRKGLSEPYPCAEILQLWLKMGGGVCLSDDSHSVEQLGTNYGKAMDWIEAQGVGQLTIFKHVARIGPDGMLDNMEGWEQRDDEDMRWPETTRVRVGVDVIRRWIDADGSK